MTESFSYVMDMVDKQVGILSLVKGKRPEIFEKEQLSHYFSPFC